MTSSPHHWFVQTDFGALLGPMPRDALDEMARTGALLVRDQVREGTDGEWRPASEVPGLFDQQTPSLGLLSSTLEDLFAPESSHPSDSVNSRSDRRRGTGKAKELPTSKESTELEFEIDTPLITRPAAIQPPPIKHELEFEASVPLLVPSAAINPAPVVVERPIDRPTHSPASLVAPNSEPLGTIDSTPLVEQLEITEPSPAPQPTPNWDAPVTAGPRWQSPRARTHLKAQTGKKAWIKGAIATATILLIVTAWWFWPRQRTDIYANYISIYKELQQRRERTGDQADWTEFVKRAKTQLEETLPWLEDHARPGDREKSLLLYAGRDLQELIELPQGSDSPHQQRLSVFFEQLGEIYGTK